VLPSVATDRMALATRGLAASILPLRSIDADDLSHTSASLSGWDQTTIPGLAGNSIMQRSPSSANATSTRPPNSYVKTSRITSLP